LDSGPERDPGGSGAEHVGGVTGKGSVPKGWINPGLSLIADPDGRIVDGPLEAQEGILYADVQPNQLIGPRWQLDAAGHYARPDVFDLRVRRSPRPMLTEDTTPEE